MQKLLGLLLGAAVHHSTDSVGGGECMSAESEAEIIAELAEITGNRDLLLKLNPNDPTALPDPEVVRRLLESLAEERNEYAIRLLKMAEERAERAEAASTSSSNDLRTPSPSGSIDRLCQLEDQNAELRKLLEMRNQLLKIAKEEAHGYEDQLNSAQQECSKLQDELEKRTEEADRLRADIRNQKDNFQQLEHDNKELRKAEEDRRRLLKEKEKWVKAEEQHLKLRDEYEKLRKSIPNLKANEKVCEELQQQNAELTSELSKMRDELKAAQRRNHESETKFERLADEKKKLESEIENFVHRSHSFADESTADAPDLNLTLEAELQQAEIERLREENGRLQLDLAKAAEPEELKRLRAEISGIRTNFERISTEKAALEDQLSKQLAEANRLTEQLREIDEMKSELRKKTAELSTAQAEQRQHEAVVKEKEALTEKLRLAEGTIYEHSEQLQRAEAERTKAEERSKEQAAKCQSMVDELRQLADELRSTREQNKRERKAGEAERTALSMRLDELEEERSVLKACMIQLEPVQRRLTKIEGELLERNNRIQELEMEVARLRKQLEIEAANTQELRDQLAAEQARYAGLMPRLRSVYVAYCTKSGDEEELLEDVALLNSIDSCLRHAFDNARAEADRLRVERQIQIEQINEFSKDIDDLKRKGDELPATDDRTNQRMKSEVEILTDRLNVARQRENEWRAKVEAEKRKFDDLQRQMQLNKKAANELSRLQVEQQCNERELCDLKAEYLEMEKRLGTAEIARKDAAQKLSTLQTTNDALNFEFERLNALHNSVTADFDRSKHEVVELKRRLRLLNDAAAQSERTGAEQRLRDQLRNEQERVIKAEDECARLRRELNDTRRDYAALLRQKEVTSDELCGLRETTVAQKSALAALNSTIQQLNTNLSEKEAALVDARNKLEALKRGDSNGSESGILQRQVELLLQRNADLHRSAEQSQLLHRLEETAERNQAEARRLEKTSLVKRAPKVLSVKNPIHRNGKSEMIAERTSDSNTDDSSIYSAEETQMPSPPLKAMTRTNGVLPISRSTTQSNGIRGDSVRITPTSSDRGSGESIGSDFDPSHFGIHHAKTGSVESQQSDTYASIASFRSRNSRIGGSLRYPPTARPSTNNWKITSSIDEDGISLHGSERAIDVTPPALRSRFVPNSRPPPPYGAKFGNSRPPPPAYDRLTPTIGRFSPAHTSTPKPNSRLLVPPEGEDRPVVRDRVDRNAKAQSFYDNAHELSIPTVEKPNGAEIWVGLGCL